MSNPDPSPPQEGEGFWHAMDNDGRPMLLAHPVDWMEGMRPFPGQEYFFRAGAIPPGAIDVAPWPKGPKLSAAGCRLYWTLEDSISVMPEDCDPDGPREPYTEQHAIAKESIAREPVVSITVKEQRLNDWNDNWWEQNYEGFDDDFTPEANGFAVPPEHVPLEVTASNGEFVTVHDFVSAVHPWLLSHRTDIIRAMMSEEDINEWESCDPEGDEKLLVVAGDLDVVVVEDEEGGETPGRMRLKEQFESHHTPEKRLWFGRLA